MDISSRTELDAALALLRAGRLDEAESIALEILGTDPTNAYATLVWGHALVARGRLDDAIATFENACRWAPTMPEMRFALASALMNKASGESPYYRKPMWAQARHATEAGLERAPEHPDGLRMLEMIRGWEVSDAAETVDDTPMEMLGRTRRPPSGSQRLSSGPTKEAMVNQLTAINVIRLIAPFLVLVLLVALRAITGGIRSVLTVGNVVGIVVIVGAIWGGLHAWLGPRLAERKNTIEF